MRFESAVELQAAVFERVFEFVPMTAAVNEGLSRPSIYVDPVIFERTPEAMERRSERRKVADDIALGVSDGEQQADNAKLAVLVQSEERLGSSVVGEIVEMARGEAEVIYIGRQEARWTQTRTNPIRLGCSISPVTVGYAGTLGCFCSDNATGAICILSNNHVWPTSTRCRSPRA